MSKLEKLFNALNLQVEDNRTITKTEGGIRSVITCNSKSVVTDGQVTLRNQSITFNTSSRTKDCSYLVLEKEIHQVLSSKINLLVSKVIESCQNPELYNKVNSQELKQLQLKLVKDDLIDFDNMSHDSIISKWEKISDVIANKPLQNGLICLKHKIEDVCIEDEKEINYHKQSLKIPLDEKFTFVSLIPYTSVEFPMYTALKSVKKHLLGITLEKNDVEILKAIVKFLFKNIDRENAYSSITNRLHKDQKDSGAKTYIVDRINEVNTPTIQLIETFNSLASHIDSLLDDLTDTNGISLENEKINLNLTQEEINELKLVNGFHAIRNYGSIHDFKSELKLTPRTKFEEFNKQLNEEALKKPKQEVKKLNKAEKRQTFRGISQSITANSLLVGTVRNNIEEASRILDSTSKDFDTKIPHKERLRHTYALAGSGAGKTSLIENLLYKDCQSLEQSTVVFDLMGKATKSIVKFVDDPSRVLIIDPHLHPSITPIINPFELENRDDELAIENRTKAIINASDIALKLKDGWSVNQKALLEPCISALVREGGFSFEDLQRMMNDELNHDLVDLVKKSPIRGHRNFAHNEFYNESYEVTKRAISAKLQVFLNDPTFTNLTMGKSTINLKEEINTKGKIIIFKLPSKQKLFARLMMEIIQDIMRERVNTPEHEIVPTHIYLDEFQNYLTPTIEEVLTESRNYKFYVTFAHQSFVQLSKRMQGIVLSNSHIKIVGQCSYDNGRKMAKEMKADFEAIQSLEQGEFIFKIGAKDVVRLKNTDRFIKDKTPYHTKQRTKHIKYQFKKYYVYKEDLSSQFNSDDIKSEPQPKHEEF